MEAKNRILSRLKQHLWGEGPSLSRVDFHTLIQWDRNSKNDLSEAIGAVPCIWRRYVLHGTWFQYSEQQWLKYLNKNPSHPKRTRFPYCFWLNSPTFTAGLACSLISKKSDMDVKPRRRLRDSILGAEGFYGGHHIMTIGYGGFQLVMGILNSWMVFVRGNPIVRNGWWLAVPLF